MAPLARIGKAQRHSASATAAFYADDLGIDLHGITVRQPKMQLASGPDIIAIGRVKKQAIARQVVHHTINHQVARHIDCTELHRKSSSTAEVEHEAHASRLAQVNQTFYTCELLLFKWT